MIQIAYPFLTRCRRVAGTLLFGRLDDVPGKKKMPPCLLRKKDGATLYATRDLASAVHRHEEYQFRRALYVVGKGQSLHFRQWFAVAENFGGWGLQAILEEADGVTVDP